jgi:hypothetical protein
MKALFQRIDTLVNRIAKNYTLWIFGLLILGALFAVRAYAVVFPQLPGPPVYSNYTELQPEWSHERRERFYQTSQGSLVIPYAWFRALEWRTGRELFASPEVQARYGLLPDNSTTFNPDRLPVGIMKEVLPDELVELLGEGQKEWASISCAACHTGQLQYKGTALRIDGGQSFWGFEQWSGDLVNSMLLTSASPARFERFCARVYGLDEDGKCSTGGKQRLRAQLKRYFNSDLIKGGINETINHTYLTKEAFARTAALGRGVNGMFAPLTYKNVNPNSGPVSYPPLWYTHDFDWVQSVAAIRQPLGRNVTESWGVSVRVELKDPDRRFASTHRIDDLFWVETLISTLQAPKWPEQILGPIDRARAERGRRLFHDAVWEKALPADQAELPADPDALIGGPNPARPTTGYCARCHHPANEPQPADYTGPKFLQLPLYRQEVMGTDPSDAVQFNERKIRTEYLAPLFGNRSQVGVGEMLTVGISGVLNRWFTENSVSPECRAIMEGRRDNLFRAPLGYPARPLDGYWSTGPFLHNGSVRTYYELLSPMEERARTFWVGTREFDPYVLGFRNDQVLGAFVFDTSLPGNSNKGHEFRDAPRGTPGVIGPLLTPEQRLDLIEYAKVMATVDIPAAEMARRRALLDVMAPYYENYSSAVPYGTPVKEGGQRKVDFCAELVKVDQAPRP